MSFKKRNKDLIEVWQDIVEVNSLIFAIFLSTTLTMGAYFIAPKDNSSLQLLFGLFGAVIGFVINAIIIKPKRNITNKVVNNDN